MNLKELFDLHSDYYSGKNANLMTETQFMDCVREILEHLQESYDY